MRCDNNYSTPQTHHHSLHSTPQTHHHSLHHLKPVRLTCPTPPNMSHTTKHVRQHQTFQTTKTCCTAPNLFNGSNTHCYTPPNLFCSATKVLVQGAPKEGFIDGALTCRSPALCHLVSPFGLEKGSTLLANEAALTTPP